MITCTTPITALRGCGRNAYRSGMTVTQAIVHARKLGAAPQQMLAVQAGWAAERAEMAAHYYPVDTTGIHF